MLPVVILKAALGEGKVPDIGDVALYVKVIRGIVSQIAAVPDYALIRTVAIHFRLDIRKTALAGIHGTVEIGALAGRVRYAGNSPLHILRDVQDTGRGRAAAGDCEAVKDGDAAAGQHRIREGIDVVVGIVQAHALDGCAVPVAGDVNSHLGHQPLHGDDGLVDTRKETFQLAVHRHSVAD